MANGQPGLASYEYVNMQQYEQDSPETNNTVNMIETDPWSLDPSTLTCGWWPAGQALLRVILHTMPAA